MTKKKKKRIVLLDSHAIIHRAYHALPDFSSSSGEPTGALYGLSTMLMALVKEFKPDHIIAAFDLPKPTYRHEAYADYKSGRKKIDTYLSDQIQRSRDVFKAFNIPIYEEEGFEADDVIGTVVERLKKDKDVEVIIASGDMDTLQLVDKKKVQVFTLRKGIKDTVLYDEGAVVDRFGFKPALLKDYKGLRGDASDNIIGIEGIGEKTATTLIQEFGGIEDIYKKLGKKGGEEEFLKKGIKARIINLLKEHQEEAEFSKMLATIHTDVPLKLEIPKESWINTLSAKMLKQLFSELEFRSLMQKVDEFINGNGGSSDTEEVEEEDVDPVSLRETSIALWILDSSQTNPTREDILHFAKTDSFEKARDVIFSELKKQGLLDVYEKVEKPLIPLISLMKENGILVDTAFLRKLSKEYHKELEEYEKDIYKISGEEFNINSPKQLGEVLFTKMGLKYKGMRKTSSGSYSTKEEVLHKLAAEEGKEYQIAEKILKYRELQKLLSTYIDNIPTMLGKDKRLHPTFLQAGTTTGRMASQDPNIQNIPLRTERGRKIRSAFVAPTGSRLVAFDYSQIELRIAAILSGDKKLIKIFKDGDDVHTDVASYVFGVKPDEVTKEMRVKAKTINFGILYGMGVVALQRNLGTDRKEAQEFYNNYFETFTDLADYLDKTKADAARKGYTETMFGRRRYFEGLNSKLPFIRAQAERMAINAPIQGTQADVIKIAMGDIYKYLESNNLLEDVKPLLQIHDEVIYEIKTDIIEDIAPKIKDVMEGVLSKDKTKGVPIIANAYAGPNWGEMKVI